MGLLGEGEEVDGCERHGRCFEWFGMWMGGIFRLRRCHGDLLCEETGIETGDVRLKLVFY